MPQVAVFSADAVIYLFHIISHTGCGQRCYKLLRLELVSECQLPEFQLYIAMSSS